MCKEYYTQNTLVVTGYTTDKKTWWDIFEMGLTQATEVDTSHRPVPKAV